MYDDDATEEFAILITELSDEIAAAIGGEPASYRTAATKIIGDIEEFSMVNWWIRSDAYGDSCIVKTDAGETVVTTSGVAV
jgi:hypothetical protein